MTLKNIKKETLAKLSMVFSMALFGTIGLFVKYIGMPSGFIALIRGLTAAAFIFLIMLIKKEPLSKEIIKPKLLLLILSGACIGANWVLLFEAYRYTTVAKATLCYYLAPVIVVAVSPFLLKEKLTLKETICVIVSLIGMTAVTGVFETHFNKAETPGLLLGFGAALLYAAVVILNKKLSSLSPFVKTSFQLLFSACAVLPYVIFQTDFKSFEFSTFSVTMLVIVGILHTGIAYTVYFGSIKYVKAQSTAVISYIDPVVAVLLSVFVLKENITPAGVIGAAAVLISTLISELPEKTKSENIIN